MRIRAKILALSCTSIALAAMTAMGQAKPAHGPFTAKDWSELRSAHASAVGANGTILYSLSYGADKGPTHTDWWTMGADGNNAKKLEMPEGFHPMGFTPDGAGLYGGWKVNDHQQFAIFAVKDGKIASAPTTIVALPRGVGSASPSPDGKRFAMTADPREPDAKNNFRHVQEPEKTSLYVVNADGTGGAWWCRDLKYISGSITVGGGASAAAWSADSTSLAVLSQVPRIGHHEVGSTIDVCSASGTRHVADIANSVNGIAWANGGKDLAFLSTKGERRVGVRCVFADGRRAWLRGAAAAVSRIDRVWRGFSGRNLSALWRSRFQGCGQRDGFCNRTRLGRSQSTRDLWMERRWIYDVVDGDPDAPLQGGDRRRGNHRLGPVPLDQRHFPGGLRCAVDR
jgi:hypothetical protein